MVMGISVVQAADATLRPNQITPQTEGDIQDSVKGIGGSILGVLQVVGIVLSVIILVVIGIKYMMGSAEEKAEYKKTMIPYLVGAVLIFAGTTIVNVVYQVVTGLK